MAVTSGLSAAGPVTATQHVGPQPEAVMQAARRKRKKAIFLSPLAKSQQVEAAQNKSRLGSPSEEG